MKAVNLIPADQQRGGGSPGGRSGGAAYVLLGGLAAVVIALAAYVLVTNTISARKAELSKVSRDAAVAEANAAALRPYREFAQLSQTRAQTVASLAASRFDWERTMRDLAVVLPTNVWLTSFVGTVAPGISFGTNGVSGASDTGTLRSSQPVPAVELVGCTESQAEVARVMARVRLVQGVTRVSLASSVRNDQAATTSAPSSGGSTGSSAAGGSTDCRNGSSKFPEFQMVVFFSALPGAPGRATTLGTPPVPGGAQGAAPKTGTTPNTGTAPKPTTSTGSSQSVADQGSDQVGQRGAATAKSAGAGGKP